MAIKFPDSITQNNSNYITVDATTGDVRGLYFAADVAARDAIGLSDVALDNHRSTDCVVYTGGVPYLYTGADVSDAQWTDANNWSQVGGTDLTSINNVLDVDTTTAGTGDVLQWNGTTWVPVPLTSDVIETAITNDASFTVDTFATADYHSATYQYVLVNDTVGARAGQFTVIQNDGEIKFTDFSTESTGTDTEPTIAAAIVGLDVWIIVGSGSGYTFKATANRL
jgi:hypothetical protein